MSVETIERGHSVASPAWQRTLGEFHQALHRLVCELPGWWWTTGTCALTAHASIGPDSTGPDAALLSDPLFDDGFSADLRHPATLADAINACVDQALTALGRSAP